MKELRISRGIVTLGDEDNLSYRAVADGKWLQPDPQHRVMVTITPAQVRKMLKDSLYGSSTRAVHRLVNFSHVRIGLKEAIELVYSLREFGGDQ